MKARGRFTTSSWILSPRFVRFYLLTCFPHFAYTERRDSFLPYEYTHRHKHFAVVSTVSLVFFAWAGVLFNLQETEEHPDLLTNLNATQAHLDFLSSGYLAALNSLDISVGVLEDTGAPPLPGTGVTSLSTALQQSKSAATTEATPAAPNPPRPSRLPKHVILGVTPMPDPERWLKKRERMAVQGGGRGGKKGRRKEGMGAGATQGLALPAEKERATSSGPTGGSVSTSSRGGGGKKGKKGR